MTPGIVPAGSMAAFEARVEGGRSSVPTRWMSISCVPRNNFYAHPYPQPLVQGCEWAWPEYWCWEDAATPKRWLFRHFTARRNDLDWSINQVCFAATVSDRPGVLAIRMGTVTPYFESYLVKLDTRGWNPWAPRTHGQREFSWQLHAGRNRLEMRVRNSAGILGPVSFLEVEI